MSGQRVIMIQTNPINWEAKPSFRAEVIVDWGENTIGLESTGENSQKVWLWKNYDKVGAQLQDDSLTQKLSKIHSENIWRSGYSVQKQEWLQTQGLYVAQFQGEGQKRVLK